MAAETGEKNIVRRNRPGTRADDMYGWPDQDYSEMESTLDSKCFCG